MGFMCSLIFCVNSLDSHARVVYRRQRLRGTAARAPHTVVYRLLQGSWCHWQAKLSLFFCQWVPRCVLLSLLCVVEPGGSRIGGNTFLKVLLSAPLSLL